MYTITYSQPINIEWYMTCTPNIIWVEDCSLINLKIKTFLKCKV